MNKILHIPVFLKESIKLLNIKKDGIYIDCTFGRGGHSFEIAKKLSNKGKLISFDRDEEAITFFNQNNKKDNCFIINSNFSRIKEELNAIGIYSVDGILFDLGVSSPQIDTIERGFSYLHNYRLDMRMDKKNDIDANYILKNYSYQQLFNMFRQYANDYNPIGICKNIIKFREKNINSDFFSNDLIKIIYEGIGKKKQFIKKYPEKKYFQAIRIEVNNEINEIIHALNSSFEILNQFGRIVVISFNSLEDKIVKNIFYEKSKKMIPKEIPVINDLQDFKIINNKYNLDNQDLNMRSKSSKIRCIERC